MQSFILPLNYAALALPTPGMQLVQCAGLWPNVLNIPPITAGNTVNQYGGGIIITAPGGENYHQTMD